MPTIKTPCSSCKFFKEIHSPMPGESWNRCKHKSRRLETEYNTPANSYGYADSVCELYKDNTLQTLRNLFKLEK